MLKPSLILSLALVALGHPHATAATSPTPEQDKKPATKEFDRDAYIKKHDTNGDGKLDDKERQAARKVRQAELIKEYDKNGDGKLDDKERQAARDEFQKSREKPAGKESPDKKDPEEKSPAERKKSPPPAL